MSHIDKTGIAKAQQLKCAEGKGATISGIRDINNSTNIFICILQGQWITETGQPPHGLNYDLITPTSEKPKCATYVRKDLELKPQTTSTFKNCILKVTLRCRNKPMECINIYAPSMLEPKQFLPDYTPNKDSYLTGDFNNYHPNWYRALAPDRSGVILGSSRRAEFMVERSNKCKYQLHKTPGTYNHFPRNASQPTISDLTFARGRLAQIAQSWASDIGGGVDSDHVPLITLMTIVPPAFQPKRGMQAADWKLLQADIQAAVQYAGTPQRPQ